jgi:hypothetical protein
MGLIRTSYDIITPESVELGDFEETGWIDEEGTEYNVSEAISKLHGCEPSSTAFHSGVWYTTESDTDYRTGAETRESYDLVRGTWTALEELTIYQGVTNDEQPTQEWDEGMDR